MSHHGCLGGRLHVAEEGLKSVEANVDRMGPGPVIEAHRVPAPTESPPASHAPRVVPLALPVDRERLTGDGDGAGHQAGDLIAGREVVVVRHTVGRPCQVEAGLDGIPPGIGVGVLGLGEQLGLHARRAQAELLERLADVDPRSWRDVRPRGPILWPGPRRAGSASGNRPSRRPGDRGRTIQAVHQATPRLGYSPRRSRRRAIRRPGRSRSSTTRSRAPRRQARDGARLRAARREPPSPIFSGMHCAGPLGSGHLDDGIVPVVELGAECFGHHGVLEVQRGDVGGVRG